MRGFGDIAERLRRSTVQIFIGATDGATKRDARSQGSGKGRIAFGRDPLPKHLDARPWPWRIVRRRKFDPELIVGR